MTSENITLETGEPHIIMDKQTQQKEVGELTKTKTIKILIKGKHKYNIFKKYFNEELENNIMTIQQEDTNKGYFQSLKNEHEHSHFYDIVLKTSKDKQPDIIEKMKLFSFICIVEYEFGDLEERNAVKKIVRNLRNYIQRRKNKRKLRSAITIQKFYRRFKANKCCSICCRVERTMNKQQNPLYSNFCINRHSTYVCLECLLNVNYKCPFCRTRFSQEYIIFLQTEKQERQPISLYDLRQILTCNNYTRINSTSGNTFYRKFLNIYRFIKEPFRNILEILFNLRVNSRSLYITIFVELRTNIPLYFENYRE